MSIGATAVGATPAVTCRALPRVMGGRGEVRLLADADDVTWLADVATSLLSDLEDRWSRFDRSSDVSLLNDHAGADVPIRTETADLLELAMDAWGATGGLFDPTVAAAVVAAGYDRTFAEIRPGSGDELTAAPTPGAAAISVDRDTLSARLEPGSTLDLGGIGKGHAADLVAAELLELGARGASVDLGGDVAVRGTGPDPSGTWPVSVADPYHPDDPSRDLALLRLGSGGAATSTTLGRRWQGPGGEIRHHLIDPSTGRPSTSSLVSVTVIAAEAAWAEVFAKATLIAGPDDGPSLLTEAGLAGLLTDDSGTTWPVGPFEDFVVAAPHDPQIGDLP